MSRKKLQKLFSPIGLGSLDAVSIVEYYNGDVKWRDLTQKSAAAPTEGELWLMATLAWGHFGGPKKKIAILTDGDEVLQISGTIKNTLDDKKHHQADKILYKYVIDQIGERVFDTPEG